MYLLDVSEIPGRAEPNDCYAYCDIIADCHIRDHLVARGEWRGKGPAIVFRSDHIREHYGDHPENFRRGVLEIMLHETAHALPAIPSLPDFEPSPILRKIQADRFARCASTIDDGNAVESCHGAQFIRIAAHLWYRSLAAGFVGAPWNIFSGYRYNLSHPFAYVEALGDELRRMYSATFAEIEATPPPQAFADLWQADFMRLEKAA